MCLSDSFTVFHYLTTVFFFSFFLAISHDIIVVELLSLVQFFETPWAAAHQASLSLTISQSLLKLMSIG